MATSTVSTCTSVAVRGRHRFQITRYSFLPSLFVRSGTFTVGGYDWTIVFYPHGASEELKDYVSVYVELMSTGSTFAMVDLRLVDQTTGAPWSVVAENLEGVRFDSGIQECSWGADKFKKRTELDASPFVRDGRLVIECVIDILCEPRMSEGEPFREVEAPPSNIVGHLGKLLEDMAGADVTFVVQDKKFAAHKWLLAARSPVFKAELCGPMRKNNTGRITIDDMQPVVFKALLHFIYTDSLPSMMVDLNRDDRKEMVRHLLVAADRYAMDMLKLMCERMLCRGLDVETVATTLALADQHHCEKLKEACIEFMVPGDRMAEVLASPGYQLLKRTCPSLLIEVWERRNGLILQNN